MKKLACTLALCAAFAAVQPADAFVTDSVNGQGIFRLAPGGDPYSPRGVNYIRLSATNHDLFEPGDYDAGRSEGDLTYIASSGYSYVRVFLECDTFNNGFGLSSPGIPESYLVNVRDFLQRAGNHGLKVILTGDFIPTNYYGLTTPMPMVEGINNFYLNTSYRSTLARIWTDLLAGLGGASSAAVQAIGAIDILNEGAVLDNQGPFTYGNGTLQVDGVTYDLSDPGSRQQMIDASSVQLVDTVRSAIRSAGAAPDALVGLSVFPPAAVGRQDYNGATGSYADHRQPLRPLVLMQYSDADYIDIHAYPAPGRDLNAFLANAELDQGTVWNKPILMGEFGAAKTDYADVQSAAGALQSHMAGSCGFGFTGWGLWTWNTTEQQNPPFWTAVEPGITAINGAVAPNGWPIDQAGNHQPVCSPVPAGLFRTYQGTVAYSNGSHYCVFNTWADYVRITGRQDVDGVPVYPRLPALMPFDGACQG